MLTAKASGSTFLYLHQKYIYLCLTSVEHKDVEMDSHCIFHVISTYVAVVLLIFLFNKKNIYNEMSVYTEQLV